jgi:6-pyruvoyltetrahydropterin/6-carboxytetrahydropterin synthase
LFTLSVETNFEAFHSLNLPDGSKEPVHSHNWLVIADVSSKSVNQAGLVMDFNQLKELIDNIVSHFNASSLEKNEYFHQNNSSAEMVAKYIYEKLEPILDDKIKLESVKVTEQPGCSAKYTR